MKSQILFIQGGASGAYDEDARLASSLQRALGDDYQVIYPRMPNEADPAYDAYRAAIAAALASLAGPVFLVGHSLGGFFLMRLLAESPPAASIAGIHLIATPYVGPGGWQDAQYALPEDLAARLPQAVPLYLYQSPDDETVPFAHLALYARRLPDAIIRETAGGHQL
ncbi:MAG TPA: alpha/beta fold hydrolase, partial [Thermomicrobiales bacterium]|nr:alpha/beta fold hydrolase [Thermomicrobiales bacterium]